jgi:hypothetical protein
MAETPPDGPLGPAGIDRLELELLRLHRANRRKRRAAALSFMLAGLGLGTIVYFLRTRLTWVRASTHWQLVVLLFAVTVGIGVLAWLMEADGRRGETEADELRRRIFRMRDPERGDRRV